MKKWVRIGDAITNLNDVLWFQKIDYDKIFIMFKDAKTTVTSGKIDDIEKRIEELQKTAEEKMTEELEERAI